MTAFSRSGKPEVRVFPNLNVFYHEIADLVLAEARKSLYATGRFLWVLCGGSTPKPLYALLAQDPYAKEMPWEKTLVFFGDERNVSPGDPASNFGMVQRVLFSKVPIPPDNLYPMTDGKKTAEQAAEEYEKKLRRLFPDCAYPRFDLVLLGLGEDGHTASLFPGTSVLEEKERWAKGLTVDEKRGERITLTAPVLSRGERIVVLAEGERKRSIVRQVLHEKSRETTYPIEMVLRQAEGKVVFFLDAAAASGLSDEKRI